MTDKPKMKTGESEKELDKVARQFDDYDKQIKDLTNERMDMASKKEVEPQTKLSQVEIERSKEIYLKPDRSIASREKFNEDYRKDYEFSMEYVRFIAENKEIVGENIELWTKPFAGMPAEFWKVPVNKPIWGPRHLAEQITKCKYRRLKTQEHVITNSDGMGSYTGQIIADNVIERLTATPVSTKKSIFMGASGF